MCTRRTRRTDPRRKEPAAAGAGRRRSWSQMFSYTCPSCGASAYSSANASTIGENGVFVVLQDSLTVGERTLSDAGEGRAVLDLRRRWQSVMRIDVSREIEELTDRKVVGFMSDNHIDPDLAVEVFVLEPLL